MFEGFIKGIVLGFLLAISVGPVIFAIIKQSINNGHKAGYFFVAGISLSDVTVVVVCNFFSALFKAVLSHQQALAIIGGIFLVGLGVYTFFFKKEDIDEIKTDIKILRKRDLVGIFVSGYLINILNPGIFLFWLAWATGIMVDAATQEHPVQYKIIVFGTCLLFVLLSDILKVQLAGYLKPKLTQKNLHRINQFVGLLMIGFGAFLLVKQLLHY